MVVETGYRAIRDGVGALKRTCDVIAIQGPDTRRFLQTQLSADVSVLGSGGSTRSLLLDPAGRLVAWVRVWGCESDDEILIDAEGGAGSVVLERLGRFKLREKVEMELVRWDLVSMRGPDWPSPGEVAEPGELAAAVGWPGVSGVDLLGASVEVPDGIPVVDEASFEAVRVECGWPAMGSEFPIGGEASVIPAEAGSWLVDASVSFTKGCYTGQELVARVDSRGSNTPRRLRGVVVEDGAEPPVGAEVIADGQVRGLLSSVAESPAFDSRIGLTLLHRSVEPPADVILRWRDRHGGQRECRAQAREVPLVG